MDRSAPSGRPDLNFQNFDMFEVWPIHTSKIKVFINFRRNIGVRGWPNGILNPWAWWDGGWCWRRILPSPSPSPPPSPPSLDPLAGFYRKCVIFREKIYFLDTYCICVEHQFVAFQIWGVLIGVDAGKLNNSALLNSYCTDFRNFLYYNGVVSKIRWVPPP